MSDAWDVDPPEKIAPRPPRVLPVVLASGAAAAWITVYMLAIFMPSLNSPRTPLAGVPHSTEAPARPPLARRVLFVVVDGLSFDLAVELDGLAALRRDGAMRLLVPPFPTYTSPALVSFVTGLDPRDHGIRLNGDLTGTIGLDTVTLAAHDAGVPVRLWSRGWKPFAELMYPTRAADTPLPLVPPPDVEVAAGRAHLAWSAIARSAGFAPAPPRALELIYIGEVDEAGHRHGAASPAYSAAAHHAGAVVSRLAGSLDLAEDALVAVSDHSHRDAGGHGGVEPEVQRAFFLAVGRGVRRGAMLEPRPTRDVAATIAALAGLRVPTSSLGRPMLDALDLSPEERALALAGPFAQVTELGCRVRHDARCAERETLVDRLARGDAAAAPEAEGLLDALAERRARVDEAAAAFGRRIRGGVTAAIAAAGFAALRLRKPSTAREALRLTPLALLHAAVYAAALLALGYLPSLSAMKGENYNRDTFIASVASFVATLVAVILVRLPPLSPWVILGATAAPIAVLAAWVGVDASTLPPPVGCAVLFETAPLVLSAAAVATAVRIAQRFPGRY